MTLQPTLRQVGSDLAALTDNCYHYWRPKMKPPFIVWQEDAEGDGFSAGNSKAERLIECSVHYFTLTEYDQMADRIEALLSEKAHGWSLEGVQYEEDTNLIHHEWRFSVALKG